MTMDAHTLRLLLPVTTCARSVLADMEPDDVPAVLRKIARSSARTLPPPLARSLLKEITTNQSFRDSVADAYEDGDHVDPDLVAFLREPETGMERIAELAETSRDADDAEALAAALLKIAALDDQLVISKKRAAELRSQHTIDLERARASVSDGQQRAEARIRTLHDQLERSQNEISELNQRVDRLNNDLDASKSRLASTTARQRRRDEATVSGPSPRSDSTPSDPLDLARWLDAVERRIRPFRAQGSGGSVDSTDIPLTIGQGVSPDSGEAVASLILQQPRRFILDGYNIGGEIDASDFSTRRARDDVIARAERLARKTVAEVLVVFDGPGDESRSGFRSAAGVNVQFSRGDKADDVIAQLVIADPFGTVVITNDRDLRDRCSVDGCIPIWTTAFLEWMQSLD